MSSPGQKRGTCGHVMALFDNHREWVTIHVFRSWTFRSAKLLRLRNYSLYPTFEKKKNNEIEYVFVKYINIASALTLLGDFAQCI